MHTTTAQVAGLEDVRVHHNSDWSGDAVIAWTDRSDPLGPRFHEAMIPAALLVSLGRAVNSGRFWLLVSAGPHDVPGSYPDDETRNRLLKPPISVTQFWDTGDGEHWSAWHAFDVVTIEECTFFTNHGYPYFGWVWDRVEKRCPFESEPGTSRVEEGWREQREGPAGLVTHGP